ncbi:MAG TPA: DNA alkylation repair protein [Thermoanaerobaculia bacterium]|nr:DNA alkylation repair protein [Thermoanaerobaculia bacterium]
MPAKPKKSPAEPSLGPQVEAALAWLQAQSTEKDRENLVRFGINADPAFGVSLANIQVLAKSLGKSHELAEALWATGWYEARLLTSFVDEPARVTPEQMDRWTEDFDNWGICDTLCFHLFDRTPYAWDKVCEWSDRPEEFVKRTAFALLASLAGHDKKAGDERFLEGLKLIERAAPDGRNFVKKGVSWALRRIGRRNSRLYAASLALSRKLAASTEPGARWIGKDALRELTNPKVAAKFA